MDDIVLSQLVSKAKNSINPSDDQAPLNYSNFAKILLVICEYIDSVSGVSSISTIPLTKEEKHKLALNYFTKIMATHVSIITESDKAIANISSAAMNIIANELISLYIDISKGLTTLNNLSDKLPKPFDETIGERDVSVGDKKKKRGFFSKKSKN